MAETWTDRAIASRKKLETLPDAKKPAKFGRAVKAPAAAPTPRKGLYGK